MNRKEKNLILFILITGLFNQVLRINGLELSSLRRVRGQSYLDNWEIGETTVLFSPVTEKAVEGFKLWQKSHPGGSWAEYYRDNVVAIRGRDGKVSSSLALEDLRDAAKVAEAIDSVIKEKSRWGRGTSANEKFQDIEEICRKLGISDEYQKLLVYRSLEPEFRGWWWEELAAKLPKGHALVREKTEEFLAKIKQAYLGSTKTTEVVSGIWELRWVYFNKNLEDSLRSKALGMLFDFLNKRFYAPAAFQLLDTNAIWKNAKEVLAEIMEAVRWTSREGYTTDRDVWGMAYEKSVEALGDTDQFWSWRAVTEAWRTLDFDASLELISLLDLENPLIAQFVIGDILMYPKLVSKTAERDRLTNLVFDKFRDKNADEMAVFGEALMRIRSPKIAQRLIDEIINSDAQGIGKKTLALRILGNLHYEDANQIGEARKELMRQVFSMEREISIEAANALLNLKSRSSVLKVPQVFAQASSEEINDFKEFIVSQVPVEGGVLNRFVEEMRRLGIDTGSAAPEAVQATRLIHYLNQSNEPEILGSFFKALMAAVGPRAVISEYLQVSADAMPSYEEISEKIAVLEKITGEPFEMLLAYMITRGASGYKSVPFELDAIFQNGKFITSQGAVYVRKGYWSQMRVNPVEVYENESDPDDIILVKGGSEYTVLSEYLTMRFFDYFIRTYLGENSGIIVPPAKLIYEGGQLKLALKHFPGYEKGTRYLQPQYWNDERIRSLITPTLLLKCWERTPENMLFRRKDWDITSDEVSNMPDVIWTNFEASLLSKATGGFSEFDPWFNRFPELDMLIKTTFYGEDDFVNNAFSQLRIGGERAQLEQYVKDLRGIFPDAKIQELIDSVFDEVVRITGEEYGSIDLIGEWVGQMKTERQLGNWNRKKPFLMNLALESLERAIKYGLRGYLYEVIKQRKYNLPEMFG